MEPVRLLEAAANIAIVTACLWPIRARIRAVLSSIPRSYALFPVASVALLIGAQATDEGERIYPLTDWGMYSRSFVEDPRFIDYEAELSSGREEPLLIGRLFGATGALLRSRIDDSARAIDESGSVDPAAIERLDAMLAAIAREYDADHPGDPIRTIRLWSGTVSVGGPDRQVRTSRRLIHEYRAR
ncbi:MAG TPA: hypothetical protein VIE68_01905 [Gemmatimonadota bacterium]